MSTGYEKKDVNITITVLGAVVIVVVIIVSVAFLNEYFLMVKEDVVYLATLAPESPELLELRAVEDSILTSYGVNKSDSSGTVYRIPLEKAMELTAKEAQGN